MILIGKIKLIIIEQLDLLKTIILNDKNKIISYILMIVSIVLVAFMMSNNYNWYDDTIVKITTVESVLDHEVSVDKLSNEQYLKQFITGTVMNGPFKGQTIVLDNLYSSSGIYDEKYNSSDEVFVDITDTSNQINGRIKGLKRDKYLIVPFVILLVSILLIVKTKGLFTILSLFINIFIFWYAIDLYDRGVDLLTLSRYMMIVFTVLSIILISGFKTKTFMTIISTLASVTIMSIIVHLFVTYSNDIDFSYMAYIFSPNNLDQIFKSQLLIAGLGAIMDIAIMMSTMVDELLIQNPNINYKDIWQSGRELGHDVMGTMINVMLFTYLCGSIPIIVLKMKMDIRLSTIVSYHMPMELYRFLLGGIGIMIAVPISLVVAILLSKKWRTKT